MVLRRIDEKLYWWQKGFTQVPGIDFNEIFTPIVKQTSIRILLALVAQLDLDWSNLMLKLLFSMDTLKKPFICNNKKDM